MCCHHKFEYTLTKRSKQLGPMMGSIGSLPHPKNPFPNEGLPLHSYSKDGIGILNPIRSGGVWILSEIFFFLQLIP